MKTSMKKYELLLGLEMTRFGKEDEVPYATEKTFSMGRKNDGSCTCCVFCCKECNDIKIGTSETIPPLLPPQSINDNRCKKNVFFTYFTQEDFERNTYANGEKERYQKKTNPSRKIGSFPKTLTAANEISQSTTSGANNFQCSGISNSENDGDVMKNGQTVLATSNDNEEEDDMDLKPHPQHEFEIIVCHANVIRSLLLGCFSLLSRHSTISSLRDDLPLLFASLYAQ